MPPFTGTPGLMKLSARHLPRSTSAWLATVPIVVVSAGLSLTAVGASAAAHTGVISGSVSEQHATAVGVSPARRGAAAAAASGCTEFVIAEITDYPDKSIGFSSSNQCVGVAPAQTIDVTLLDQSGNQLDYADNSCSGCQVLGASGVWPGPAVAGERYTMEISTVLALPPVEVWASYDPTRCALFTAQTLGCQASISITAK